MTLERSFHTMLLKESLFPLLDLCGSLCESRGALQLPLTDLLDVDLGDGGELVTELRSGDVSTYGVRSLDRPSCQ